VLNITKMQNNNWIKIFAYYVVLGCLWKINVNWSKNLYYFTTVPWLYRMSDMFSHFILYKYLKKIWHWTSNTAPGHNLTTTKWSFPSSVGYIPCPCAWEIVNIQCKLAFICINHLVHIELVANPFFHDINSPHFLIMS